VARSLRWAGWALVVAAALTAFILFGLAPSGDSHLRKAPALPRERLAGGEITLPSLVAGARGRPSLVLFWASWCGPCEREAAAVERFSQSAAGHGRIVGVDWSDARSGAQSFIRRFGWTFPTVRDADGAVGNAYGLTGLPTTFVLDGGARIRAVLRGPQDERSLERALASGEKS
jgi:cytochrome c biogenesis protein CcmG, thiol:disulfide interchange protein DsbE